MPQKKRFNVKYLYLLALLIGSSALGLTRADPKTGDLTAKDQIFMDLREASRKNDALRSGQLANQLNGYEMPDYVEYFRLKPKLYDSAGKANGS